MGLQFAIELLINLCRGTPRRGEVLLAATCCSSLSEFNQSTRGAARELFTTEICVPVLDLDSRKSFLCAKMCDIFCECVVSSSLCRSLAFDVDRVSKILGDDLILWLRVFMAGFIFLATDCVDVCAGKAYAWVYPKGYDEAYNYFHAKARIFVV